MVENLPISREQAEDLENDFLTLIEKEVDEAERKLKQYGLQNEETGDNQVSEINFNGERYPQSERSGQANYEIFHSSKFVQNPTALNDSQDKSKIFNEAMYFSNLILETELLNENNLPASSNRQALLYNEVCEETTSLPQKEQVTPKEIERLVYHSDPATKKSVNNYKHYYNWDTPMDITRDEIEYVRSLKDRMLAAKHCDSIPSNHAHREGYYPEMNVYEANVQGELSDEFLYNNNDGSSQNSLEAQLLEAKQMLIMTKQHLKQTQDRLARSESNLSVLQVEYDILNNSHECLKQEVDKIEAENTELRKRLTQFVTNYPQDVGTTGCVAVEKDGVDRWPKLFQKAVSKLAQERQKRIKAENEKQKAMKELEVFEEDIMKRFVALRKQSKDRAEEMEEWALQMQQVTALFRAFYSHTKENGRKFSLNQSKTNHERCANSVESRVLKSRKPPLEGILSGSKNTNEHRNSSFKYDAHETKSSLRQMEKYVETEHTKERKVLEKWRNDAQKLIETLQSIYDMNIEASKTNAI